MKKPIAALLILLGLAAGPSFAQTPIGASGLKVVGHIAGPDGGWDYASFDPQARRIYVAHGDKVLALDLATGKLNPAFADGARLHAVVPVPGLDRLVTTNSGDASAKVLDARTGRLIASIPVAKDPDSAIYDPFTRTVVVIGGDSGVVTLIDPKAAKKVAEISTGGKLEFNAVDGKGGLWINDEEKHEIVAVNLSTRRVVAHYPMAGCLRPTGLAYVAGGRLVSACQAAAKILDARTGRDLATLPIGVGPDAVIYDPARALAYIPSGRAGTLSVIALSGPKNGSVIDTVTTRVGARTGTVDARSGRVYLPSADYVAGAPGQRPQVKPGTFEILVLGR